MVIKYGEHIYRMDSQMDVGVYYVLHEGMATIHFNAMHHHYCTCVC